MKILIIGSGAREHALAWRVRRDAPDADIVISPGNCGTVDLARHAAVPTVDIEGLVALARHERADLTIVGPEAPLERGIADRFAIESLPILGPTRVAAKLETSKAFAKAFMARHGIPTARFVTCESPRAAKDACDELGYPVVVKADGLAAGKGVTVAADRQAAFEAVDAMMVARQFGEAGTTLVVEECLTGPELSVFALCDGRHSLTLGGAHDHKRAFDDDRGPNTGGMGAYAPSPLLTSSLHDLITRTVVEPVLAGMAGEGHPYRGFLYAGLMLTADGPKVIEFNARLGDPETQVVLPLVQGSLLQALVAAAHGDLGSAGDIARGATPHVGVVLASGGYPDRYDVGLPIDGIERAAAREGVLVFHAGTTRVNGRLVTSGGRVLTVVAAAPTFEAAVARAYAAVDDISFSGMHVRRDIGRRAVTVGPTIAERP